MPRPVAALLAFLVLLAGVARAEPTPPPPVTEEQKAAIVAVLKDLHTAYEARDVQKVMGLIHEAVEATARKYQADHPDRPGADQQIREAFVAFHEDIFQHREYHLLDFQPGFAEFSPREDGSVEVLSNVPIVSTDAMTFEDSDGTPTTVRLRLGRFVLRPAKGCWQIVEMDLF